MTHFLKYSNTVLVLLKNIKLSKSSALQSKFMLYFANIQIMDISQSIRFLRKQKGWTQQQLADFANTSKSNISNLENGNQGYSSALLLYLANAFGCRVSQIFLLAEHLEKQPNKTSCSLEEMPIELLILQLPSELQEMFKSLMIETIKQIR